MFEIPKAQYFREADVPESRLRSDRALRVVKQGVASVLIGLFIAAGGTHRWRGQSLEVAMGFSNAPVILGAVLLTAAVVLTCGAIADHPQMIFYGAWVCGIWHFLMATFALFKLAQDPGVVDDVAFFLWFYLGSDYLMRAQSHRSSGATLVRTGVSHKE